jgi:hypothetical protein
MSDKKPTYSPGLNTSDSFYLEEHPEEAKKLFRDKAAEKKAKLKSALLSKRCWEGYKPTPGKKPYEEGSCEPVSKSDDKPFKGYNPKKHSRTGGLNSSERERINRTEGRNLKAPVTSSNPSEKDAARRRSFCARMSGVPGPTSKDGKLTPKGASLKRWKCSKSLADFLLTDSTDFDMLVKAGSGEGSRGGKVTGHTKSGKPIYGDSATKKPSDLPSEKSPASATHIPVEGFVNHYSDTASEREYKELYRNLEKQGKLHDFHGHLTFDRATHSVKPLSKRGAEVLENFRGSKQTWGSFTVSSDSKKSE